ncbi:MAG: hypothetical protein DHS20C18_45260 [Saprospiraceae bacterium]|nr:MAG: hypothetical protein DHS20C18_45260 [Saprospiraceae bacterium]
MKKLSLSAKIVLALILGILYAAIAIYFGWQEFTKNWIAPFGDIFIRALKFIAVPLVLFSIIAGVASLPEPAKLGRIGVKSLVAYVATSILATIFGMTLTNLFQPGKAVGEEQQIKNRLAYEMWVEETNNVVLLDNKHFLTDSRYDTLIAKVQADRLQTFTVPDVTGAYQLGFLDENAASSASLIQQYTYAIMLEQGKFQCIIKGQQSSIQGTYVAGDQFALKKEGDAVFFSKNGTIFHEISGKSGFAEKLDQVSQQKDKGPLRFFVEMIPENIFASFADTKLLLQIIFFAIFFGIALLYLPSDQKSSIIPLINDLNEVFLKMVDLVMQLAPFFVFALMAGTIANMASNGKELIGLLSSLLAFSLVVVAGLGFLLLIFYPLLVTRFVKKFSYRSFMENIFPAQSMAFSTSSSAATLPVTMKCVQENLGVSPNISNFVLPIGATVNMDGTSFYQAVCIIFLAQLHLIDLSLGEQFTIVLLTTLSSIGSAAVPSGGIIMLMVVLETVGLNPAWIAIIYPMDRILDMLRTVVNVTGDISVTTLIAQSEGEV